MSLRTNHILDHAERLAMDEYKQPYYSLPKRIQDILFKMGEISAINEVNSLVNNRGENA